MAHQERPGSSASPPRSPPPSNPSPNDRPNPPRGYMRPSPSNYWPNPPRRMQTMSQNPVHRWVARNRLTEEALANESPELTDNSETSEDEITEALESEMGITEQEILRHIQQVTYQSCPNETNTQNQTCTICQEDYVEGERIGRLDCMHIFHLDCIKQWLELRNVCPICKETALEIDEDEDA